MAEPAKRNATYADIEALPEHVIGEILYGTLVTQPSPSMPHGAAQSALSGELSRPFQKGKGGPGGWVFVTVPELHISGHVLVPDIGGWKRERMPAVPKTAHVNIAPDWICEILSESTEKYDRGLKRDIYREIGVQHLWLLDPGFKYLECFQCVANKWLLDGTYSGGEPVRVPPFDAIEISLNELWPSEESDSFHEVQAELT